MLGSVVDTLLICTATALMIIISGTWQDTSAEGVTLTANAFAALLGPLGTIIVFGCVICFASTTIFTYAFYGTQCTSFLLGAKRQWMYRVAHVAFIVVAAVISIDAAVNLIDGCFALMAIPTMISSLYLAPKVREAAKDYFARLAAERTGANP